MAGDSRAGGVGGPVERLCRAFGRLPGIGAKSAERLAHHILKCAEDEALELAAAIEGARRGVKHCELCFHLTESENDRCAICRDDGRDQGQVCVVEQTSDLLAIEKAGSYRGVFHVLLGKLAPLQGMSADDLTIDALVARVSAGGIREVILATNPNLEGDGTALLIAERLRGTGVSVTRLARGLASGSALEFANKNMLSDALIGRRAFDLPRLVTE
jgi:recombination protein RecR